MAYERDNLLDEERDDREARLKAQTDAEPSDDEGEEASEDSGVSFLDRFFFPSRKRGG